MKRYWVFIGNVYYPLQGLGDFKKSFDTKEGAIDFIESHVLENKTYENIEDEWQYRWGHVYDMINNEMKLVWEK